MEILPQTIWIIYIFGVTAQEGVMMSKSKTTGSANKQTIYDSKMEEMVSYVNATFPDAYIDDIDEEELKEIIDSFFKTGIDTNHPT